MARCHRITASIACMFGWNMARSLPPSPQLRYGLLLSPLHGQPNVCKVDFEFDTALSLCEDLFIHMSGPVLCLRGVCETRRFTILHISSAMSAMHGRKDGGEWSQSARDDSIRSRASSNQHQQRHETEITKGEEGLMYLNSTTTYTKCQGSVARSHPYEN